MIYLIAFILIVLLVVLFVGGILKAAGDADKQMEYIEPEDLMDDEHPCSWCQKEKAIKSQPHESHGICKRHAEQLLRDAARINRLKPKTA